MGGGDPLKFCRRGGGGAGSERKESLQILGLQRLVSLLYMCELNVKNI